LIPVVFLFDLDGVMVQPSGYRAAVRATVNHFARCMGLPDLAPDDHTVAIFEAQGITCEWDMIPITLAILMDAAAAHAGQPLELNSLTEACDRLRNCAIHGLRVEYAPVLRRLGQYLKPGEAPAESLLALCSRGEGSGLFPRLTGQGVLRDLFMHTRRPAQSQTTHLFETYVLGDRVFSETMGMRPVVETASLLEQHDRPLLAAETRARLIEAAADGLRMAVYTARPSLPLLGSAEPLAVFAPEAEMALNLIGMQWIPLIGSGQMGELALRLGENEDRLTKPAPYHALAAIAAAWLGDRSAAMAWVERLVLARERGAPLNPAEPGALPDRLRLHVFEDSPSGMRGAQEAARILSEWGTRVEISLWGIAEHPEKRAALAAAGAALFADVNQAVAAALEQAMPQTPA